MERRFKKYTGLTVKEFSGIVRFHATKNAIINFKQFSLLEIGLHAGFYDQAHLNHEFQRIAGENPGYF